jgi:hypothetical protein
VFVQLNQSISSSSFLYAIYILRQGSILRNKLLNHLIISLVLHLQVRLLHLQQLYLLHQILIVFLLFYNLIELLNHVKDLVFGVGDVAATCDNEFDYFFG